MDINPFAAIQSPKRENTNDATTMSDDGQNDDFELPEDLDMPPMEDLLRVTTDIDNGVKEVEQTPVTPRPTNELKRISTADPPFDLMSQHTEINEHEEQISKLSTDVRLMNLKVEKLSEMDIIVRNLATQIKELTTEVGRLRESNVSLRKDFTQYQTLTSQSINDVERRAKTNQLSLTPTVDVTVSEPPDVVTVARDTISTTDRPTVDVPIAKGPVIADLGDFM